MVDLSGKRFNRWTVITLANKRDARNRQYWLCQCDCGNQSVVRGDALQYGQSKSCGCLARELSAKRQMKHGYCANGQPNGNATYITWKSMKQRCYDPNSDQYHLYGALGIKVCDRWRNSFQNFLDDMGERPVGMTLDRINPFGDYEPGNCRWADAITQNNNQRRHYIKLHWPPFN